ncbi:MAG: hypothetical protein H6721_00490 [Sandaracinus sp.]|nr:hypothetical protein [Myxococcales bacterium]MCB9618526.1 hypothetical protein [Sandaracinus sp.]MCB9622088.1 hypothetical protein [Sandaracinus sp.]MCB9630621.1 hypothetical protein [Sandaracinus sp.]
MQARPEMRRLVSHLYLQRYPAEVSDVALAEFLAEVVRAGPTLDSPHSWVLDFREVKSTTAVQRKMFADFQLQTEPLDRRHNAGSALVMTSGLVRGFVTAVFWLKPPVYPTQTVASLDEGVRWAATQLAARGVSIDVERAQTLVGA